MREIQAIMRQIASSITYLPCLDEPCNSSFFSYLIEFRHHLFGNSEVFSCFDKQNLVGFWVCSVLVTHYVMLFLGIFDVLAYTDKDVAVPFTWIESDPKLITNPQMVKLHSFDTKVVFFYPGHINLFFVYKNWLVTSFSYVNI